MQWLNLILLLFGVVLATFAAYEVVLAVASIPWLIRRRPAPLPDVPAQRMLIVIPAHNESVLIAETVKSVLASDYPAELREVIVIADNCTDDTAVHARGAGAMCLERKDLTLRGKPYALKWVFEQVDVSRYDAVVIIDADTVVDGRFLRVMDARLRLGEQAIQGFYGVMNPDDNWLTRLGVVPATLNNYLTFPGKRLLGLSCPLAGNGMCFDARIIRQLGWNAFTLSEDWEYYLILALHGYVVTSAPEAVIYGQVAHSLKLGEAQRMRWMKGRIDALVLHWRPLLRKGLRDRDLMPLDAIFDIARPTHSILLVWSLLYLATCTVGLLAGVPLWLSVLAIVIVGWQVVYFVAGLAISRPPLRTWLALFMVPWYLVWKFGVTLQGLLTMRERSWVRTTRN